MKMESTHIPTLICAVNWSIFSVMIGAAQAAGVLAKPKLYQDNQCTRELNQTFRADPNSTAITLYYKDSDVSSVDFKDTERGTTLQSQIKALGQWIIFEQSNLVTPECNKQVHHNYLYKRSSITVTANGNPGPDGISNKTQYTILTGPVEHWYIGFDLPVINHNTLKYDATSKTLVPQNTNPQIYLSINYGLTDVIQAQNALALKLFLLASNRPLDSVGLGLGYRLPSDSGYLGNLSALSLFGGYFWTRQDSLSSSGVAQLNQGTMHDWRFGISYDFNNGLKYLK